MGGARVGDAGADGAGGGFGAGSERERVRRVMFESPEGDGWVERLRGGAPADAVALRVRRELGLPTDRAIVMTGHQPGAWHAGIASKELAVDAIAERFGAAGAAITVDHQGVALTIRLPKRDGDWRLYGDEAALGGAGDGSAEGSGERGVGWVPAFEVAPLERWTAGLAVDAAGTLLGAYHRALVEHRGAGDAGSQLTGAMDALLSRFRSVGMHRFTTRELARTGGFGAFVRAMLEDGAACAAAYNAAAGASPGSGIALLDVSDAEDPELPLWVVGADGSLQRGSVQRVRRALSAAGGDEAVGVEGGLGGVVPRAVAMTGFLRRYACEMFVHGTGGGVYDAVAERWLRDWLGWSLAPMLVVSADVEAAIHSKAVDEEDLARAVWRAHHARHDPDSVGDSDRAKAKGALLRRISAARGGGGEGGDSDARRVFGELHALLREHRTANAGALRALEDRSALVRRMLDERALAGDRAWALPVHSEATVRALRSALEAEIERALSV